MIYIIAPHMRAGEQYAIRELDLSPRDRTVCILSTCLEPRALRGRLWNDVYDEVHYVEGAGMGRYWDVILNDLRLMGMPKEQM